MEIPPGSRSVRSPSARSRDDDRASIPGPSSGSFLPLLPRTCWSGHTAAHQTRLRITLHNAVEMLFQLALVRQHAVQTAIETRVVDLAFLDFQQIVQRR